jgi:hypothetical protein
MQLTLAATIILVMLVVFAAARGGHLGSRRHSPSGAGRNLRRDVACGFSIDNLSLMALAVSVGFVVDDAIVMIENRFRNLETACRRSALPWRVRSRSASPCFRSASPGGSSSSAVHDRADRPRVREFSVTLAFAIAISTLVSLSLTPMICAHFVRKPPSPDATWLDRLVERIMRAMVRFYASTLGVVLNHRALTLLVMVATMAITVMLYIRTPKGFFPIDDTGLIWRNSSLHRSFVPGHVRVAAEDGSDRARRSRRRIRRLIHRHIAVECVGESRLNVHQPQAAVRAGRHAYPGRDRAPAAKDRRYPGSARVFLWDAGRAGRRAPKRCHLPVHALGQ